MAMIDYGAIVFKNGKQMNHSMFTDMKESVGWSDEGVDYVNPLNGEVYKHCYLNGNLYAYIGDEDFTIGFYKSYCRISWRGNTNYYYAALNFDNLKSHDFSCNNVTFHIKEVCSNVYLCSLNYKGDNYNVIFGYGIDPDITIWDKIKVRYLGKCNAQKVDKLLAKYGI